MSKQLKLVHGGKIVGTIRDVFADGLWYGGTLELTTAGGAYREMFDFMTADGNEGKDPPVDDAMMQEWYVEEADGKRDKIGVPAVHEGEKIYFRFK